MIADTIEKHGFITISTYAMLRPEVSRKAHEKRFAQEVDQGRIKVATYEDKDKTTKPVTLGRGEYYYILTGREVKARGLHRKRSRPLGAQSLVTHMGYLLFCIERGTTRLTLEEIKEDIPEILIPGVSSDRYVLLDGGKTLGLLLVDCGSDVRHIARKVRAQRERRFQASDAWKQMIHRHEFRVIVIVATHQKAKRLRRMLNNWGSDFEVVVFEEMGGLIND